MGKARNNAAFGNYAPNPPIGSVGEALVVSSGGNGLEYSVVSGSGGGGSGLFASSSNAVSETITQASHPFTSGSAIYLSGSAYALSYANTASTAEVIGIVESVSGNDFTVVYEGKATITSHGLGNGGDALYLDSGSGANNILNTEPISGISKPVGYVVDSNTILVKIFRGAEVGGTSILTKQWDVIAGNLTLTAGRNYLINASSVTGSFTFPASPNNNDNISLAIGAGDLSASSSVLLGNGKNFRDSIQTDSGSFELNTNFPGSLNWVYNSSLNIWILT